MASCSTARLDLFFRHFDLHLLEVCSNLTGSYQITGIEGVIRCWVLVLVPVLSTNSTQMTALRDVSATKAAIIYGLEPVWGAGFACFLLGERWDINGWIGAALVLAGSLTVQIIGATSNSLPKELKTENELSIIDSDKEISSPHPVVTLNTLKDSLELVKK